MDSISLRPRGIGEILDGALRLYRQDIGLFVLTAILGSMPMAIGTVLLMSGTDAALIGTVLVFVALLLYIVVWGALMIQMNDRLHGSPPTLGSSMTAAGKLLLRFIGAGILLYLLLLVLTFVLIFGVGLVGFGLGAVTSEVVGAIAATVLGFAVMLTIGVRAFAGTMLFMPGIVAEGLTAIQSIKRGFALTKEGSYRVVTVISIAWFLIFVPLMAVYFVTGTFTTITDPEALSNGTVSMGQLAMQQLLSLVASGFTTPFLVACTLLTYYDQRVRLEAFDLETEADSLAG